jgi:hypothetical protein
VGHGGALGRAVVAVEARERPRAADARAVLRRRAWVSGAARHPHTATHSARFEILRGKPGGGGGGVEQRGSRRPRRAAPSAAGSGLGASLAEVDHESSQLQVLADSEKYSETFAQWGGDLSAQCALS